MAYSTYTGATLKEVSLSSLNTQGTIKVNIYNFYGDANNPIQIYNGIFYIEATCGNQTIKVNNTDYMAHGSSVDVIVPINWTPPISWASQNTTGTSVSVVLKLYVKWDGESTFTMKNSKTVTLTIPSSVKPSTSMALSDTTSHYTKYGSYIKGKSKVKVQLTNTLAYSSPIASYNIKANGTTYTTNPATTNVLSTAGTNTITAYVTDKRGRSSSTVSQNITVLDYANPSVNFSVGRCDEDGTANEMGGYCKVTYSVSISSLSSKNTKALKLSYKASSDSAATNVTLSMPSYSVTNQTYIFQAIEDKTYNITLSATDDFVTTSKSAVLSTAYTLMHFNQSGRGLAIGKLSEGDKFEVGMPAEFSGGINGLINCNGVDGTSNIIDSTTKDTVDNWKALGNNVYFFNTTGCLIDQPSQYGFLQNYTRGVDVHQIWLTQSTGSVWHRGGNASGWNGTWRKMWDNINIDTALSTTSESPVQNKVVTNAIDKAGLLPTTQIPANANLNTLAYCNVGRYYCSMNSTTATLSNCPTSNAFVMEVYSPLSKDTNISPTGDVYRVRKILDYRGNEYIQDIPIKNGSVSTWNSWKKDIKNVDILCDAVTGTKSVASSTNEQVVCSVNLTPGVYVLAGTVQFPSNSTGYRTIIFSTTYQGNEKTGATVTALNGQITRLQKTRIVKATSNVTLNLYAYQNSGSTLSCVGSIEYVKLT